VLYLNLEKLKKDKIIENNIHRNGNSFCRNIPKINNEKNINEIFNEKGHCINKK